MTSLKVKFYFYGVHYLTAFWILRSYRNLFLHLQFLFQKWRKEINWGFCIIIIQPLPEGIINPLIPSGDQDQFSPNNIQTLSKVKLGELMKWSPKRKCLNLLSDSLNYFLKEMYGDQFGEFVCGYRGLNGYCSWTSPQWPPWGQKKVVIVERLLLWGGRGVIWKIVFRKYNVFIMPLVHAYTL